jgi:signal transduction histidine kinase
MASDITLLLEDTFAFINPDSSTGEGAIPFLLTTLNGDIRIEANVPAGAASLLTTVESLIAARTDIEIHLDQIGALPIRPNAVSLRQAASDGYQDAVASAERARTFLSGYAVVLLLVIAVIGYRLRNSYRELNLANAELGELNESLEQRVESRTAELTNALTELKESQVQLVQAEKMSSLGQLVAGISHEINTPLLYLANNAELTQERVEIIREFVRASTQALCVSRDDFADSADFQAHLAQSLKRLRRLLLEQELEATVDELGDLNRDSLEGLADLTDMAQSLKDFSRLDRAPVDSFDVNAGIEKTLTIARNIVKHKAEVVKQFGELPAIECSPSKINQVFLNLITNAAQAIEDQGQIVIETRRHDADHVVIAISDNGCGIPPGNLDKICDPFFTTKEVGSGTGLGLSIVDEIVRSHGGELLVESRVGQGSTFSVVLPIRHPAQASEPKVDALLAEAM